MFSGFPQSGRNKKAQVLGGDFILSMTIFLFIIVLCIVSWNTLHSKYSWFRESETVQSRAFHITDTLLKSQGYPENWSTSDVEVVGLAEYSHVLDSARITKFEELAANNYTHVKNLWGIKKYDFYITLNTTNENRSFGIQPSDAGFVVSLKRLVLVNETGNFYGGKLNFVVWRQ